MARYKTAFYSPMLSDWTNYENWEMAGAKTALDRATGLWQQALREYEEPVMPEDRKEALDEYVTRRRTEIGFDEP